MLTLRALSVDGDVVQWFVEGEDERGRNAGAARGDPSGCGEYKSLVVARSAVVCGMRG